MKQFLRFANGLATALGQLHKRGLIHIYGMGKRVEHLPGNVFGMLVRDRINGDLDKNPPA
jgi:hypothetical protein